MDPILIRYGETVTLPLDTGDITDVSANFYVGKPGMMYSLTKNITLTAGKGTFEFSAAETQIPLGTYYYQINVTASDGSIQKFPSPEGDGDYFPEFVVAEALDLMEVS